MASLAFDLGGTFLRCGVVAEDGTVRHVERLRLAAGPPPWDEIVEHIASFARRHARAADPGEPLVVAFPGPLDASERALCAPTVAGGRRGVPDLATAVGERSGRAVRLINDVSAAGWYLQDKLDAERFVVVTVSSGIGCKLVDRGRRRPVVDDLPYAGEIGHVVVDERPGAPLCDCGGSGHLGAIASGRGIERSARRIAAQAPKLFARSLCARSYGATAAGLTNEAHLVPAARAGDPWAWAAIRTGVMPLARALALIVHVAAAQRIVVIGGFAQQLGQRYADELTAALRRVSSGPEFEVPVGELVVLWDAEDEPCLRGAAAYGRSARVAPA